MQKPLTNQVQSFYDQVGDYFSHTRGWLWPEMLPYLNILKENDTVLDVGCGNGRLLGGLAKNTSYVGVDFSKSLLANARRLHPNSTFIEGDILSESTWQKLPIVSALFCVAVLHHIPRRKLPFLFQMFARHTKKGGLVYVSSWNLWQKRYLRHHLSLRSIWEKFKTHEIRSVLVPFQKTTMRYCVSYFHHDFEKPARQSGFVLEKAFFSGGTSYLSGGNLVQVYRKV